MVPYERHVFICVNERDPSDSRGCCSGRGSLEVASRLKELAHAAGLKGRVRINKSGCLDMCGMGPTVVVYPEAVWYGRVTLADADEIFREHVLEGRPVERLRIGRQGPAPAAD